MYLKSSLGTGLSAILLLFFCAIGAPLIDVFDSRKRTVNKDERKLRLFSKKELMAGQVTYLFNNRLGHFKDKIKKIALKTTLLFADSLYF